MDLGQTTGNGLERSEQIPNTIEAEGTRLGEALDAGVLERTGSRMTLQFFLISFSDNVRNQFF